MRKLDVLFWADTPTCATGFAQVAKNILRILNDTEKYNFHVLGINHTGEAYDQVKFPYRIDPAVSPLTNEMDLHGRGRVVRMLSQNTYDILFILNDTFLIESVMKDILEVREKLPKERQFAIVYYFPIDARPAKSWIENSVLKVDIPVAYTQYAKQQCEELAEKALPDLRVIYHGTNKKDFFVERDEDTKLFKTAVFGPHAEDFIVLNVNRNQPRKDLHRTFAAFKLFKEKHPKSFLFMLCQMQDIGGDIGEIAKRYGLVLGEDWACPAPGTYYAAMGYTLDIVRKLYNAASLIVSTTLGEGWGLSSTEAFSCKRPILFPKNTSLIEIIGEDEERGYFCSSGEDLDHFTCLGQVDNNIIRPIVNVFDMADKMCYIAENYEEAKKKAEKGHKWAVSWEDLAPQWEQVFEDASHIARFKRGTTND